MLFRGQLLFWASLTTEHGYFNLLPLSRTLLRKGETQQNGCQLRIVLGATSDTGQDHYSLKARLFAANHNKLQLQLLQDTVTLNYCPTACMEIHSPPSIKAASQNSCVRMGSLHCLALCWRAAAVYLMNCVSPFFCLQSIHSHQCHPQQDNNSCLFRSKSLTTLRPCRLENTEVINKLAKNEICPHWWYVYKTLLGITYVTNILLDWEVCN